MKTPKIHFTNPKLWSKKNKIIAAIVAAVLVLASIAGAVITSRIQHQKECQARSVTFADKLTQLDQSTAKAHVSHTLKASLLLPKDRVQPLISTTLSPRLRKLRPLRLQRHTQNRVSA